MLPLPSIDAFILYKENIICYNITRVRVEGRDEAVIGDDFSVQCVIQPINDKNVELDFDGQISSGLFMMHTFSKLQFNDITNKNQSSNIQTIVKYGDEQFKVIGIKNWSYKTNGINKYILSKYTEID